MKSFIVALSFASLSFAVSASAGAIKCTRVFEDALNRPVGSAEIEAEIRTADGASALGHKPRAGEQVRIVVTSLQRFDKGEYGQKTKSKLGADDGVWILADYNPKSFRLNGDGKQPQGDASQRYSEFHGISVSLVPGALSNISIGQGKPMYYMSCSQK